MPILITGACGYQEHGDCSELKREIHIEKDGLIFKAYAFKDMEFYPINKGRLSYKRLLNDIEEYKKKHDWFYRGYESRIVRYK